MRAGVLARSTAILAIVAGMLLPALTAASTASAQATGPKIVVGSGEPGYAVNLFGPSDVTVAVGTTLTFQAGWLEPHTVTFPGTKQVPPPSDPNAPVPTNPGQVVAYDGTQYVSSGFIAKGGPPGSDSFQITMAKAGSYPFVCIIHPGMAGTVKVVAAGQTVSTQAELDAAATKTFADALATMKTAAATASAKQVTKVANADGTSTWQVITVGGLVGTSDLQQFFPPSMNVQEGDTVVWQSSVPTPHTVTFLGGEDPDKLFADLEDPISDPRTGLPTNPPATGYTGVGFINSGIIGQGWPGQSFTVKFTKAGAFSYACILHVDQGMGGVINVAAKTQVTPTATASPSGTAVVTATPAPPKTGNGDLLGGGEAQYLALMLIGFGATLLVGVRIVTGRWR